MSKLIRNYNKLENIVQTSGSSFCICAELNCQINIIMLNKIIENVSYEKDHFWLRCYSNEEPPYQYYITTTINPVILISKEIPDMNYFINYLTKIKLSKGKLSQFYLYKNFIGVIVLHSIIDGIHLMNTLNLICNKISLPINEITNINNNNIKYKIIDSSKYIPQFPSKPICPIASFPYEIKYDNNDNSNISDYMFTFIYSLSSIEYDKLNKYINFVKMLSLLKYNIKCGPASVLLTLLSESINITYYKTPITIPIECAIDLKPFLNIDNNNNNNKLLYNSLFSSYSVFPINIPLESSTTENCVSTARILYYIKNSYTPFSYINTLKNSRFNSILNNSNYNNVEENDYIQPLVSFSSFGNFEFSENIKSGPFIGQIQSTYSNMIILSSIHDCKHKKWNFSFYINKKIDKYDHIFSNFIRLIQNLKIENNNN